MVKSSLASKLEGVSIGPQRRILWKGPSVDGVTQSMLNTFLMCRERFRVAVIDGLSAADTFSKALEFGNMWHICEECHAAHKSWVKPLDEYAEKLRERYPLQQDEIRKWFSVCEMMFPEYTKYWNLHPDVKDRVPVGQEQAFKVPYTLESGRTVFLRGKYDSVDRIPSKKGVYLQENKTKGDIQEFTIQKQLTFDLQTMLYLTALSNSGLDIGGVRYNVIRRPFSGGRGSIRQHQPSKSNPKGETETEYYDRLMNDYVRPEPAYWFMRWTVDINDSDLRRFQVEFLNPILEQLCDWYEWIVDCYKSDTNPFHQCDGQPNRYHWRSPYGTYNVIAEGGTTDLDEYLNSGSTVGLVQRSTCFPELE